MAVSGVALGAVAAGGVLVWAGLKGYSIPATIQDLISGKSPAAQQVTAPVPVAAEIASAAAAAAGSVTLGGSGSVAPSGGNVTAGGTLGKAQLEQLWINAGGSPGAANMAAAIALAESDGRDVNSAPNSDGTIDRGYWQVNSSWGPQSTLDPLGNARAAVAISGNGTNWGPWTTFRSGAYKQFL